MFYLFGRFLRACTHAFSFQKVIVEGEDGRGGTSWSCSGMQRLWVPLRCPWPSQLLDSMGCELEAMEVI